MNRRPLPPVSNEFGVRLPQRELQQTAELFDILPGTEVIWYEILTVGLAWLGLGLVFRLSAFVPL